MVAIPWKFESSYPHQGFGVVAQLIERYVRIVEVVGLSPISSTRFIQCRELRHYYLKLSYQICFKSASNDGPCVNIDISCEKISLTDSSISLTVIFISKSCS